MVNYPIGIQTFDKIRQGGYLYIDKTKYIYEITHPGQYVFLSRPRRFGKSLLMSTFDSYFRGRKDLFKGLAIEKLEKDWTEYPVLHFDLSDIKKGTVEDFGENVNSSLASMEGEFGIAKTSDNPGTRLKDLVERIYNKTGKQVVLLFDEYDAPLLTVLHDPERLETMRTELQSFYSPIKKLDPYLRFVFITGITKFSQLSIFSQLNNLNNISMLPQYAAMCGITIKELEDNFQEGIAVLAEKYHYSHKQVIDKLLYHYDGYHFAEDSEGVLNPFSLLSAMNNRKFNNYWFSTGTPTFLVNMMRKFHTDLTEIDGSKAMQEDFDAPTENMHNVLPLFYQSGYLTIKDYNPRSGMYTLGYPNEEVKVGLMRILIPFYVQSDPVPASNACWDISEALMDGDIDKALAAARSYFASIPYQENTLKDAPTTEGHFTAMLYVMFSFLNRYVYSQVRNAKGRLDILIKTDTTIYVMELKLDGDLNKALKQINEKDYTIPYQTDGRKVVKVAINFSTEERTIKEWKIE
ncbi:MAG: AAA family ATPase [Prevotella sp.]|jgi:hypothetical protein